MMTSAKFVFSLICLFLGEMAHMTLTSSVSLRQERRFVSAKVGESVMLQCFYEGDDSAWLYWYKQTLGQKPRLISTFYVYDTKITFQDEFKNSQRFRLRTENKTNHLTILDLRTSDSATYYCASSYTFVWNFTAGTIVSVQGSGLNAPAIVHMSASETIQPGGSVTLNCTVHTGTCDVEHSVYWFRNSEESNQEIIYTHGGRNDQCEKEDKTQTHTCVYSLPMKSLKLSHAGTYYCAVVSCGYILFGNGTKLDFEHEVGSLGLVYFLSGALTITTILVVSLAVSVYKKINRNNCPCTESQPGCSAPSTEGGRDMENLHYAALSVHRPDRSKRQRNTTKSECVYSSVKL
uniref:immunoglobulin kappa light chain-like n=1 Tax=Semicossyphus pulcher TaxID=241346 RepID=UPI0037E71D77